MQSSWENIWQERRLEPPQRMRDVRSAWERDYARIIHSAAFRRLQSKTQVLDLGQGDFYRTRLTHSMEVAQVGSGIIKFLQETCTDAEITALLPDTRLLSAICLAHDLGHPPFGHDGEVALNFCMRQHGGFEGNGQTLRILSSLEQYTKQHGLNPTRRLLFGILKYPASYSTLVTETAYGSSTPTPRWLFRSKEQTPPKCYLDAECHVVDWVLEPLGEGREEFCATVDNGPKKHKKTQHCSLDASIMNLADDISYALHDLEDAVTMGMLTRSMWEEFTHGKEACFTACGFTSNAIAEDVFAKEEYRRKGCIGALVHYMITNSKIVPTHLQGASPLTSYRACLEPAAAQLQAFMGKLVFDYVIASPNVQLLDFRGRKIVVELFDVFATDPERLLPLDVQQRFLREDDEAARMRVVCDYIACMTDAGAARLHNKLFHAGKGSVFDKL